MQDIKRFINMKDVYKDVVRKIIPSLIDSDDFEAEFKYNLECPGCRENLASGLYFRMNGEDDWFPAGNTIKCSGCRDTDLFKEYQEVSLMEQKMEIGERLSKEYFLIPEELKNAGFKNYIHTNKVTENAKKLSTEYVKSFLKDEEGRYNLLIMGNPGTGKSHLCAAIGRTLKAQNYIVGFLTSGQLLSKIKATYRKGATQSEEEVFQDIKKLDLLVLDDLGSEAIGGNDDWRKSMIFEVVNSRIGKPTIYTSNLTDLDLPVAVGNRVSSRLYDNTKFIDLFIDKYDYRKSRQIV